MTHQDLPGRSYAALLFDMDGTILNSIAVANRVWTAWAERHGIDPAEVRAVMHGVQAAETVRRFAKPGMDPAHEAALITAAEIEDVDGVVEIAGARHFLGQIADARWAVVTSAPRALALRRMAAAGLPLPRVMISAEDIPNGKPAPDCFLAAAEALGVGIEDCLVWEDAPAGIVAAEAAGAAAILVVSAAHASPLSTPHRTVRDYRGLAAAVQADGSVRLTGVTP